MTSITTLQRRRRMPLRPRGVSMLFALMTLVALSLAAVSLVRSVDTGALILGNMGFKEDTVLASDEATRQAVAFVQAATALDADIVAAGYYTVALPNLDVTGRSTRTTRDVVDWKLDGCTDFKAGTYAGCVKPVATKIELPNGVSARYVVMMLCTKTGATSDCLGPMSQSGDGVDTGALRLPDNQFAKGKASAVYYRVVVRTEGARNAVTFTEAIAHSSL